MLVGRDGEQRALDALLESARKDRSAVLVLRGEPGIGKTALLEYAEERAEGMRVLRCGGIESEAELPFAGLHQLVRPCLDLLDRLPPPQAVALRSALGLSFDAVQDRYLVSLGLLSLLAEACEQGPVLCCVDDAQWLDHPSAEALSFAARRFEAEPIVLLMAAREGEARRFEADGLPELELAGLSEDASRSLLADRLERAAPPEVLANLVVAAHGNPLALLELPAALSETQLRGTEPILGPPPLRSSVEEEFRARASELPEDARRVLLLAAAEDAGDLALIRQAAERLGLGIEDLEVAEREGLVRLNHSVTFRHPLVRSAVYRSATLGERRAAHEALAEVAEDPVRRAWHRALVAERADEQIAGELEAAGAQAAGRGAQATASAAFERAAELSEKPVKRGHRLQLAAHAALNAGRSEVALALVERARPSATDPHDAVELDLVQLMVESQQGSPADAYAMAVSLTDKLAELDRDRALMNATALVYIALMAGTQERGFTGARNAVERIAPGGPAHSFMTTFLDSVASLESGDSEAAGARLYELIDLGDHLGEDPALSVAGLLCFYVGDFRRARLITERALAQRRARSSLAEVAGMLPLNAYAEVLDRRLSAAMASATEGVELAGQIGFANAETFMLTVLGRVAALQGREEEARELIDTAMKRSLANGLVVAIESCRLGLADLELGMGDPREALEQLEQLDPTPFPPAGLVATPDLVEAAVRLGEPERAQEPMARYEAWAPVSRAPAVQGNLARCRGMLAETPEEAERWFQEALEIHSHGAPAFERARTQLTYGERLRRERRKTDARTQLRVALDTFEGLGTAPWAERARGELAATGETARKRNVETVDELTPQERRIAQLVAAGATNRDVAAQLFVSPKTVEYHLRKVFLKVGVTSRVELARIPLGEPDEGQD
jgi:DNA-binding CsgD family transcriptional regulator